MSNKRKQDNQITDFFSKKTKAEEVEGASTSKTSEAKSAASAASGASAPTLPDVICNGKFRVQYDKKRATKEAALKILNEAKK